MEIPDRPVSFVPVKTGEVISLGPGLKLRVMEDGSNTDRWFKTSRNNNTDLYRHATECHRVDYSSKDSWSSATLA